MQLGSGLVQNACVAFANTADDQYDKILGKPATASSPAVPGDYQHPLRLGHTVTPLVLELFVPFTQTLSKHSRD